MTKPIVYVCTNGYIVWYGKRGFSQKLTYSTYSTEDYDIKARKCTMKQLLCKLKMEEE